MCAFVQSTVYNCTDGHKHHNKGGFVHRPSRMLSLDVSDALSCIFHIHRYDPILCGWSLPSRTWNQWTFLSTKQLTWFRISHSGYWCLCLMLHTHSGACQKWINVYICGKGLAYCASIWAMLHRKFVNLKWIACLISLPWSATVIVGVVPLSLCCVL